MTPTTTENTMPADVKEYSDQVKTFNRAAAAGYARDFAIHKGGTGDKRPELNEKDYQRLVKKRKATKAARKANR